MSESEDMTDTDMDVTAEEQMDADEDELLASSDSEEENNIDDDDDDDEDDLEDDEDSKLIKTYLEVLARIEKNKYSYDDYVLLVDTAHAISDLDKIRQSCELFASVYPLAPEIWLKWLRIELTISTTEAEYRKVNQLFRRALADYYSSTVALEYANLLVKTPTLFDTWEVLISTYSFHCMQGRALFEAWRAHCLDVEPEGPEKYAKIVQIYEKELAIPLYDMEETYIELKVLCEKEKDKYSVDWLRLDDLYQKAKEQLVKCMVFEKQLLELEPRDHQKRATVYAEYIEQGRDFLSDQIVQVLYERMVTDCCLSAPCWMAYIEHIQQRNRVETATSTEEQHPWVFSQTDWDVCNRAIRNCTWSAALYIEKMHIAERMNLSREDIQELAEFALAAGFQVPEPVVSIWLEYLSYLRRSVDYKNEKECEIFRATFELAWDTLGKQFGVLADCNCEILQMWGRLEYGPLCDLSKGKQLWTTVMESADNASKTGLWIEFAHLELRKGVDGARKILRKALAVPDLDDLSVISCSWIRFERCNGTLSQLKFAQRECEERLNQQKVYNTYSRAGRTIAPADKAAAGKKRDLKRRLAEPAEKKFSRAADSDVKKKPDRRDAAKTVVARKSKDDMGPPSAKREKLEQAAEQHNDEEPHHEIDTTKDDVTVFLSNLSYNTTEENIIAAFPELSITNVNIIKSVNGNSRGFSYVQLGSIKDVEQALIFDRRLINGRPAFISSVLRDKERRKKFKYSDEMEPTKLFVKGLNFETKKEDLETLFGAFGDVKDVRMVVHKNGNPKGIAYVEFVDEKASSKAILSLDQTEYQGFKISVAISAPPVKPQPNRGAVNAQLTLGQGRRNPTAKGEMKPRMSFIPRVVQKNALTDQSTTMPQKTVNTGATNGNKTSSSASLQTNDDFRKFLTQSK